MNSYHIFYFPFTWELKNKKENSFSEQTQLENIQLTEFSDWLHCPHPQSIQEENELYDEKNYFYRFVHPVLYDTGGKESLIWHFERKELQQNPLQYITYQIAVKGGKTYSLQVDNINLNLYTTGVGMLSFYLINDSYDQAEDILKINQFGRRIFPPFMADIENRWEIAESISIQGLNGNPDLYMEDFTGYKASQYWYPGRFIRQLISDLSESISIEPVIDDRMFVNCWYGNNALSNAVKEKKLNLEKTGGNEFNLEDDFWYKFLFIDGNSLTCQNAEMRKELICNQTYKRWQNYGSLFGVSRYAFVLLAENGGFSKNILLPHIRTIYSRMIELVIIQRASILKFSGEVTRVSGLSKNKPDSLPIVDQISSLYKEYIRFVNQIYFREVTTQDQGIELYDLLSKTLKTEEYVEDLDKEIEELHQYASLLDEKLRNKNAEKLGIIAAIFLPATLITGLFGMNYTEDKNILPNFWWQALIVVVSTGMMFALLQLIKRNKR